MADTKEKIKEPTLVAGPYVGEFGWEVISWQPMIHNLFRSNPFERCVVYTGPGRSLLYPWAEVRTLSDVPDHQPECLAWRDLEDHKDDLEALMKRVEEDADAEFENFSQFGYPNLKNLCDPYYMRGWPDLLTVKEGTERSLGAKSVILCVRDRPMSTYRNWDPDNWIDLANSLVEKYPVIVIGQTREDWEGFDENVRNMLNNTTIDDCIGLFQDRNALAVGGCTGTIHLASRCACPHLVWGGPKIVRRVAATNWFGTACKVYIWGWDPDPGMIETAVNCYLETGEWM